VFATANGLAGTTLCARFPRHQPTGYANLDAFATETQRGVHCFAHRATESDALFKLQCDGFSHQLRIEFRAMHFLNIDVHFALGALFARLA